MSLSRHRRLRANNSSAIVVTPALPSALSGLVAWGEGSDLGTDGSQIASWLNKTGSGLDPAQATAGNRPTVKANAINGQKAALFTAASSQYLLFPAGALSWFNNVAGVTFAAVVLPTVTNTAQVYIAGAINSAAGTSRYALTTLATGAYRASSRITDANAAVTADSPTGIMSTSRADIVAGAFDSANGANRMLVNGAVVGSGAFTGANSSASDSAAIAIGATGAGTAPASVYLAAYAMWNVAYSASQLRGVLLRWSQLYGIALS